jgi:hypothetical protein
MSVKRIDYEKYSHKYVTFKYENIPKYSSLSLPKLSNVFEKFPPPERLNDLEIASVKLLITSKTFDAPDDA